MRISGDESFKVFKLLMDLVAQKSKIHKEFKDFNTNELKRLSVELRGPKSESENPSQISYSTLRDYRYMYIGKDEFKAESEKLTVLCSFINEISWELFAPKNGAKAGQKHPTYFYKSQDLYLSISKQKLRFNLITSESTRRIHQSPEDPEPHLNLAICLLYQENFREAGNLLSKGITIDPTNPNFYFFLSLAILEGKRPYQHRKVEIDQILALLKKATLLEKDRKDCMYLMKLVHRDFHDRIGYPYKELNKIELKPHEELLKLFEICCGMPVNIIGSLIF